MRAASVLAAMLMFLVVGGCSTTGTFRVPDGSELYIYERPQPVSIAANGIVSTKPFFWTAAGIPPGSGIPYRLERDGQTVEEGRLRTKFRVVSIFWPPFALIYWPMGFNPDITYDLIKGTQE